MSRVCIIIGFCYDVTSDIKINDVKLKISSVLSYVSKLKFGRITIVSDVYIQNDDEVYKLYRNKAILMKLLSEIVEKSTEVMFYYHGKIENNEIILPVDGTEFMLPYEGSINLKGLKMLILELTSDEAEILIILDLHKYHSMPLSYVLSDKIFRLNFPESPKSSRRKLTHSLFEQKRIIVHNEYTYKSVICISLTNFTSMEMLNLRSLIKIQDVIKGSIYVSLPTLKYIWRWCTCGSAGSDVKVIFKDSIFIVS